MHNKFVVLLMLLGPLAPATAQVSIGIALPNVSIGINLQSYPKLEPVPGYPVFYAPQLRSNYFFYDGMYWIYQDDRWYASSWYNGPWGRVDREVVPLHLLRVPVRYYRHPPPHFRGWRSDAPPRWGQHWGNEWAQGRSGWDRWDRSSAPAAAPLPVYQRHFSGSRYPRLEQQQTLQARNYGYQPHDPAVRESYEARRAQSAQRPHEARDQAQRSPASQEPKHMRAVPAQQQGQPQRSAQSLQRPPESRRPQTGPPGTGAQQESADGHGHGRQKEREKADDRRHDHD